MMKQGDVYLRKEDNRMYVVAMESIRKVYSTDKDLVSDLDYTVTIRPLQRKEGEPLYYSDDLVTLNCDEFYEYQYNLFDRVLSNQEA